MSDKEHSRVRFDEDVDTFGKDNEIVLQSTEERCISVHLGFLKLSHRYQIVFTVPSSMLQLDNCAEVTESSQGAVPNVNCKLLSANVDAFGCHFKVELFTYKEKLLKETLSLEPKHEEPFKIILIARILGKGKGTPLLRNGIKCIAVEEEDESEASDWQGFD